MINQSSFPTDKYSQFTKLKTVLIEATSKANMSEDNKKLFKEIIDVALKETDLLSKPAPVKKTVKKIINK
jgi:hypothetical protein